MNIDPCPRSAFILFLLSSLLLAVAGCGGSGGGNSGDSDAKNTLGLSWSPVRTKQFHFSWNDVATATEYRLLENPDGVSGFSKVATVQPGQQNYDLEVFLPGRINASYILQTCNADVCTDSATVSVSGTLTEAVGYFKASNTGANGFGYAVALSGDGSTLAVGAPFEGSNATGVNGYQADNSASNSGAVYVFTRSGGNWSQQAYVKASNSEAGDNFGYAVALSADGNTLAVGADSENSNATGVAGNQANNLAPGSGAAYVFTRSGSSWSQQAYVKASNAEARDSFGDTVALSSDGNTLAVGAPFESSNAMGVNGNEADNSASFSGAVYVFTRSGSNWSQQAYVKASNTEQGDLFAIAVALSGDGNTLAVGASSEDSKAKGVDGNQADNSASFSGAVYVFWRSVDTWSQQAYVKPSNTDAEDFFGSTAVALSGDGNTLAVGAFGEDSNARGVNGNEADNSASQAAAVYVFARSGDSWAQQAYVKASNTDAIDLFGHSVALAADGNTLVVGALGENSNATGVNGNQADNSAREDTGAVYVFTRGGSNWSQQAYVKASNTHTGVTIGEPVALSADGRTLAVGAWGEASSATGVNGDQADTSAPGSGAVYLY